MAASDFVAAISGAAAAGSGASDFIAKASGATTADTLLSVDLGPDMQGLEPYASQSITATVSGGTAATVDIEQFAGPAVLLFGPGPTWTYTTPGSVTGGPQLMFRVIATPASGPSVISEVTHYINPNTFGYGNALGQMVGAFATTTGT